MDDATRTELGVEGATKQRCRLKVRKVLTNYLMEGNLGRAPRGHVPPYRRPCGDVVSTRAAFDTRRVVGTGAVELGEWDLLAFPEDDHPKHSAGFTEATAKHPQRKYI